MMERKYSSEEMRSAAFGFEADPENCLVAVGPEVRPEDHPATIFRSYDIAAMLRQAAARMERSKYEYAEMYSNGDVSHEKGDSPDDVNRFLSDGSVIVRREVGEWEEVK